MKLNQIAPKTTQRVIVYGGPKVGKTELVGNLSTDFNLLWIDVEKGYTTLTKLPLAQQERIEIISLPDTRDYPIAIETLLKVFTGARVEICEAHGKVSCMLCKKAEAPVTVVELNALDNNTIVVVDSLTQVAVSAIANITKGKGDDYRYDWEDYRKQGSLMDKLLSNMQQASYNLCIITHEVEVELEDGRKKIVPCAGTSNFSRNTAKYFDHVVYCQVQNKKHSFGSSTVFGTSLVTGSRTGVAIEATAAPTLLDIFKGKLAGSGSSTAVKTAATAALESVKAKL